MDQCDSLEDWVSIKENPFEDDSPKIKMDFQIAWNEQDFKIAITCHKRVRVEPGQERQTWTGLFTFIELKSIHEQLALVHPSLGPYFPELPTELHGIWAYISSANPPSEHICEELHRYLQIALDLCGDKLLISTFFEEHCFEEYFEKISELRRRGFDDAVHHAEDELQNVLFLRSGSINMLDMMEVYGLEDKSTFKWNIALAELYNYLIQPFLDMRELAFAKLREAKGGLENPNLGERRKTEYATMFSEWQDNYVHALDRIQELYLEYYGKTLEMQSSVKGRMLEDKERFGKKAFEIATQERLNR